MILLSFDGTSITRPHIVAVFGSGLIGSSIIEALQKAGLFLCKQPLTWTWPSPSMSEMSAVETTLRQLIEERPTSLLSVIWAAGNSGFGSSQEDMEREHRSLRVVLSFSRRMASLSGASASRFFFIGSAGGLFEGQIACQENAHPRPLRPYGHGKLSQEATLQDDTALGDRLIIRPSSVYGYSAGARFGLISALVFAAMQGRTANIFGALSTQRDFIFAPDIGRYVARRVFAVAPQCSNVEKVTLASGRPASVFEIIKTVEEIVGVPLYLKIDARPDNARDNTFHISAVPPDFHPTPLREGIELTKSAISKHAN